MKAEECNFIVGVIPNEGLVGRARQSFFWYDNDKDLKAHFLVTHAANKRRCVLNSESVQFSAFWCGIPILFLLPQHIAESCTLSLYKISIRC